MGFELFRYYKQTIQDSLNALARRTSSLSSIDEQRLGEAVEQFRATISSLDKGSPLSPSSSFDPSSPTSSPGSESQQPESFMNLVQDGHVISSPDGLIQMANQQATHLFDKDEGSLVGHPLSQFVSESDWPVILEHMSKLVEGEPSWEWVMRMTPPDRSPCLVSCIISGLRDPDGTLLSIHWLFRDFTAQQRAYIAEELVRSISEQVLSGLSLDQTMSSVCRRFIETFPYPLIWIGTKEQDGTIKVRACAGERHQGMTNHQERWKGPIEQQDAAARAIQGNVSHLLNEDDLARLGVGQAGGGQDIRSGIAVPLSIRNQVLGVLNVYAYQSQAFDSGLVEWLERLAAQLSLGLFLARDYDHLRLQGAAVSSAEHAVCITNPEGHIEWINEAYRRLTGYEAREIIGTRLPSFPASDVTAQLKQAHSLLPKGQNWKSELVEKRKDGSTYTVEQVLTPLMNEPGQVTNFVAILQDITDRKVAEARMVYRAHHDPLTDLPNRAMFQDRLTQALARAKRQGRLVSVMFVDLDEFKQINDEFGHGTGDALLKVVGTRLTQCVRATDTVARLSGDEFTLILQDLERLQDIHLVAHKILDLIVQPILLEGRSLSVKSSIGIAIYPLDATDPEGLLKHADRAMYKAKSRGGHCCQFASEGINLQFSRHPVSTTESVKP